MHIGLNAHLLSPTAGYRTAGIHGYIYNLLSHLAAAAPPDWNLTGMVGARVPYQFPGIRLRHARFDTESPVRRIIWEQALQPWQLSGFDLYHALTFVSPLLLSRPSVVTVYDLSFIHYPKVLTPARRLYLRWFTAMSCRRARRVIGISHSTALDVHESLGIPMDRIDVAACGYDQARYVPLPAETVADFRQRKGLPERFWLFVGTLEPRKNLVTLLDAYAALPASERLPLVIGGGKGWLYEDIFERVSRYQLQDTVTFPGFLPADELPLWYNSAEAFIFPSVFEGFGLPVLEAMACGTPVLVSDASSLPEVAGDAGMCLPPHDAAAWTEGLRRVMLDTDWREQASQRGVEAAKRFTWQAAAEATVTSYQRALGFFEHEHSFEN
ncbi:MAG: glycosyltransferase family 1 protein [bacterium]|nr:glycosyltransferase family 1 protein [bacterium]